MPPPRLRAEFRDALLHLHTLRDLLRFAVSRMRRAGLYFGHGSVEAYDEAAHLCLHALHLPPDRLEPFLDALLLDDEKADVLALLQRRITTRKPLAYLTQEAWLTGHAFYVDERVIVPRSFIAELLAQEPPVGLPPARVNRVLDLCTGGGSLAILAALRFPEATIDAVDCSLDALEVAHRNVSDYGLEGRVFPIESDLYQALTRQRYDLIIANPPYVDAEAMEALPEEYRAEPTLALASGSDGLDHTRRILAGASTHLRPQGRLVVEIGHQRPALTAAYPKLPFVWPPVAAGSGFVFVLTREQLGRRLR
jgi:ribosomal protein L3 glutamine methyltransferase